MGIHDRDWQRQSGPVRRRGGGGGQGSAQALQRMRGFNATTWIVIICAFVFIIDGFGKPVSQAQLLKPSNWTLTNLEYEGSGRLDPLSTAPGSASSQHSPDRRGQVVSGFPDDLSSRG